MTIHKNVVLLICPKCKHNRAFENTDAKRVTCLECYHSWSIDIEVNIRQVVEWLR